MNNKDRDMFYSYGYNTGPFNMPNPTMLQNNLQPFVEINNRLNILENQQKKLEQRISKLENPYSSNYNNEPDSKMYMM